MKMETKMSSSDKQHMRGFTIVELAVVIVVIAILAAITIVSYSGMRERAQETAVMSDLRTMGDAATLTTTQGLGAYPTADQAGLESIVSISKPEAYHDGTSGSLLYCRSDDNFSFVGRVEGTKVTYMYTPDGGVKEVVHSGTKNTLCANSGVPSSSPGYQSLWIYSGNTVSPRWPSWVDV